MKSGTIPANLFATPSPLHMAPATLGRFFTKSSVSLPNCSGVNNSGRAASGSHTSISWTRSIAARACVPGVVVPDPIELATEPRRVSSPSSGVVESAELVSGEVVKSLRWTWAKAADLSSFSIRGREEGARRKVTCRLG